MCEITAHRNQTSGKLWSNKKQTSRAYDLAGVVLRTTLVWAARNFYVAYPVLYAEALGEHVRWLLPIKKRQHMISVPEII